MKDNEEELIYLGAMCDEAVDKVFKKANEKRKTTKTFVEYTSRGFNKHFKLSQKQNATIIALIGEDELKNNTIWVKNIKTNEETTIAYEVF